MEKRNYKILLSDDLGQKEISSLSDSEEKSNVCFAYLIGRMNGLHSRSLSNQLIELDSKGFDKIVLLINSEGGEVDGTKFLADTVRSLNTQIVAYIQGICCSGAYWVASQCDYIVAENECSLIGSIGTQTIVVDDSEYLKNQGIKKTVLRASKSVDKNVFIDSEIIKNIIDPLNEMFISSIQESRNIDESALTGKVYLSNDAFNLGLIDHVSNINKIEMKNDSLLDKITQSLGLEKSNKSKETIDSLTQKNNELTQQVGEFKNLLTQAKERIEELEKEPGASPATTAPPRESSSEKISTAFAEFSLYDNV